MNKICNKCGLEKDILEFKKNKESKGGISNTCKICTYAYMKIYKKDNKERLAKINRKSRLKWAHKHKEKDRNRKLKAKYGIDTLEFEKMFNEQNGVCAICNKAELNSNYLSVDHNHDTGKVRQLLCKNCNSAIGLLQDNTELLKLAIEYLEKHK